jgi:ribosomal protein S18 acetylase RimI-like enzyme
MTIINIKKVKITELNELQAISRKTFAETFAEINTKADMDIYLSENLSTTQLMAELNEPNSEFYFATLNNSIIGYLKINFGQSQTELPNDNGLEVERIYVLKEYHGKKVGQQLLDKALSIARHRNASYIWLGVWENNLRAISFYKKNGFVEFDKHPFLLGNDEQTDIMMKFMLR